MGAISPDPNDPELVEKFRRWIDEIEETPCPCGWVGDGKSMTVREHRFCRELHCPACDRLLVALEVNY